MKKRIRCTISNRLYDCKATIQKNKSLLYIGLICCILGLILSFFSLSEYIDKKESIGFLEQIIKGNFSPFRFEVCFVLCCIAPIFLCFLLSLNFYILFIQFGVITLSSFLFWRYVLSTIVHSFLYGFLEFIILIPIYVLCFFGSFYFLLRLFEIVQPCCSKKITLSPYRFTFRYAKKYVSEYLFYILIPSFVYINFIVIIVYLICNA